MAILERLCDGFSAMLLLEFLIRILLAAACGSLIGLERSRRFKDAGIRTHSMVACTAALLMIISKYGFADLGVGESFFPGVRGVDPSRIAAQVVSGVSFLGAGIIYRDRNYITKGLTTAAGIWAVAGIGMAIGAGLYITGLFTAAFIMLLQYVTHRHNVGASRYNEVCLELVLDSVNSSPDALLRQLESWGAVVTETKITRQEDQSVRYRLMLKLKNNVSGTMLHSYIAEHSEALSVRLVQDV